MRAKILAAAFRVFADKGPDAPVIDDFIREADISRGTFYSHFKTTEALLVETSRWLEDERMRLITTRMAGIENPVERVATGVRLWLQRAREDAVLCAFVVRNRYRGKRVEREVRRDIRDGQLIGKFSVQDVDVARDLLVGTIREAMGRMMDRRVPQTYVNEVARAILRSLGLQEREIERVLARPLAAVAEPPGAGF